MFYSIVILSIPGVLSQYNPYPPPVYPPPQPPRPPYFEPTTRRPVYPPVYPTTRRNPPYPPFPTFRYPTTTTAPRCPYGQTPSSRPTCETACEPTCDNPNPTVCTEPCVVRYCNCLPGWVRNTAGACVQQSQCPPRPSCPFCVPVVQRCVISTTPCPPCTARAVCKFFWEQREAISGGPGGEDDAGSKDGTGDNGTTSEATLTYDEEGSAQNSGENEENSVTIESS